MDQPQEEAYEWHCPNCGASIRARMADRGETALLAVAREIAEMWRSMTFNRNMAPLPELRWSWPGLTGALDRLKLIAERNRDG